MFGMKRASRSGSRAGLHVRSADAEYAIDGV